MVVNLLQRVFGQQGKYKKKPTAWSKSDPVTKGDRAADPIANDHIASEYANTHIQRWHDGTAKWHCFADGKEVIEEHTYAGSGVKHTSDGSRMVTVTGNSNEYTKGSHTTTRHGNLDEQHRGQVRTSNFAGTHLETYGDAHAVLATKTEVTLRGSGKGHYHVQGKHTINTEKGIGMGVSNGTTPHLYHRMFEDGSYRLQVQPQGETGGVAVVDITKDGAITVTTDQTHTTIAQDKILIQSSVEIKLKAPVIILDGAVSTSGSVSSDGSHTATAFHGVADAAKRLVD
jgi:hypothetical protein